MELGDITLLFKTILSLELNHGVVMNSNEQSIAIIKREDKRGIYYSINDTINKIPQKVNHQECAMTLLLINKDRFKYPIYKSHVTLFN